MRSFSISALLCLFPALFFLCACREEIPHEEVDKPVPVEVEEDPILKTEEPGAYGVPGGDLVLRDGWQLGILHYGNNRQNLRMVQPAYARVASLCGLPRPLTEKMSFDALFLVADHGFTRMCIPYRLQVVRVKGDKVWLKESDDIYFVLEQCAGTISTREN